MGSQPIPVGEELRRAREAAGLEISDVAAHLRIRSNFLSALEEGRPDALPGVTYAIGYVRTYAGFLGLDPEVSVRRFKEEAAGLNSRTELVFPSPAPEGRVPGVAVMLVALLLAGGAYGGWYWVSERDGSLHDLVPLVPERLAQLIEGEAPSLPVSAGKQTSGAAVPAPRGTTGTYADANPTGVELPPAGSAGTATPASPSVPPQSVAPQATSPATTPVIAKPAEPASAPLITAPQAGSAPGVAPNPTLTAPAPAVAVEPPPSRGGSTTATAQAPGAPVPAETTVAASDDTPDVTALPEPTSAARQSAVVTPPETSAPPQVRTSAPVEPDVPAAPRIAGLIGASEAAVPVDRTTAGPIDRIMIRATGDSWVQVRDSEGTALFTRVLREGDIYRVPSKAGLKLATGNAGALDILVDGVPAPRLGGFGDVVRNITLDPARLAAGTAASATR